MLDPINIGILVKEEYLPKLLLLLYVDTGMFTLRLVIEDLFLRRIVAKHGLTLVLGQCSSNLWQRAAVILLGSKLDVVVLESSMRMRLFANHSKNGH